MPIPYNQIFNPEFIPEEEGGDPLKDWSHSGDVTVVDRPTPLQPPFDYLCGRKCVALGPGGEIGQLLGYFPAEHDLHFCIHDDETPVDLTVTIKYTEIGTNNRSINIREETHNRSSSDLVEPSEVLGIDVPGYKIVDIPLEDDTYILNFTVANDAPEGEGIAPLYLGPFVIQIEFPSHFNWIDPRWTWWLYNNRLDIEVNSMEPHGFWTPPSKRAMSPYEKMLTAQVYDLDRKLVRLTKRLGAEKERSKKPTPRQEQKWKEKEQV